ncbi:MULTISPECIES: DNA repair protein RecO [Rhodomicrobium]|uniref:DNA repair protein RecO n=1 Tax=Rhodomicrobium TaxID=1068 RepID=UPI000B4A9277|nr:MULTISPECIES: DNA repair protein RecO [Rhodomicrobium]
MDWTDTAIVLQARPHGETSAVLDLFTREHGRHHGLVRGGRSRKIRPTLQTGNLVSVEWRARLSEQLGYFVVELDRPYAARALDDRLALSGIGTLAGHAALLAERDPHPNLFDLARLMLDHLDEETLWPQLLVRFELLLLAELGFGLDLERCAATGAREGLTYVSPKSGSAVSAEAGAPYKDKLMPLPPFLRSASAVATDPQEVAEGFALTGFFLERHVFEPRGLPMPPARQELLRLMRRAG